MTAWTGFYDHILPEVNGVAAGVVNFTLRQVCIDFCEETGIHRAEVTPINVVAGTAEYTLTSPVAETEPYKVAAAWHDDLPLDIATLDVLSSFQKYWPDTDGTPRAYTQKQPDKIVLYPNPETALTAGLRVELILRPTQTSTGLTTWIAERYMDCLAYGVKGRLMAQPNRPWTNPDYAAYYLRLYGSARTAARAEANTSLTRAALSVRPRPAA